MIDNPQFQQLKDAVLAGNIPQLALTMISMALDMRASDIHIEPEEHFVRIRYRIDGSLLPILEYPTNIHPAVVSRIKIMSNLKIDEQRIPQDGRCQVTSKDNRSLDLRVSTFPTVNGEKIVMRIQDKSRKIPGMDEIGLEGNNYAYVMEGLKSPNGVILTSGPTGSGKTTTLYTCLNMLNTTDVNILTIEDPVEIQMDGLSQSQVHHDISYDFATGMRAALRQDPNIIMVGEIRDHETVDIAIEAALTGHLVLSTIHTNSAVETLTRIENMEIEPFLVASTVEVIIAQRLVRKLCQACKVPQTGVDPVLMAQIDKALAGGVAPKFPKLDPALLAGKVFYAAKGCDQCGGIGYFGRMAIYEVLRMNNEIRHLILERTSAIEIEKTAIRLGMITLEQDGLVKCLQGITSLEEIYSVARKVETYV